MKKNKAVEAAQIFQAIIERSEQWVKEGRMKPRWVGVRPGNGGMVLWRKPGPSQASIGKN